jgi:SAM-dependent methyltransferase
MFQNSKEVHEYYLTRTKELIGERNLDILKTDCWNEAEGSPIPGGIADNIRGRIKLLEIDRGRIEKCATETDAYWGDIRKIPFRNNRFDLILDLSTLDHIPFSDVPTALAEYARVLNDKGEVLLFVWCGEGQSAKQFTFPEEELLCEIKPYFGVISGQVVFIDPDNEKRYLVEYVLRKKTS